MKNLVMGAVVIGLMAGCATSGTKQEQVKEDKAAAARSQVYMESLELVPVTQTLSDAKPCMVPATADKVGSSKASGPSKEWKTLVAHASTCVKEKNYGTLETLANAIARIDIDSPWGAYFLSVSAEGRGEFQRALWMADLAQKKAGGRSGLYSYQKGRILYAMKEISRSMKEINRAVELDPKLAEGHFFLAEIYHRDLELDSASASYAKVIEADSKHYGALAGLAEVKVQQGKGQEAADLYQRAIAVNQAKLNAWTRLAFIYETMIKNQQQALSTYKGMKSSLDSGALRERPSFDVNAKIKDLQDAMAPRVPAAAVSKAVPDQKTVKK